MRLIDADALDAEMNDLISRQAAIDAVAKGLKGVFVEYQDVAEILLNNLPSAQPTVDAVPVIRCKDCKHRPIFIEDGNGFRRYFFPDDICPGQCDDWWYNWMPDDDWFCANGERIDQ